MNLSEILTELKEKSAKASPREWTAHGNEIPEGPAHRDFPGYKFWSIRNGQGKHIAWVSWLGEK